MNFSRKLSTYTSRRNFSMKDCFEKTNNINSVRQKFYSNPAVGAENPTYLKLPRDKPRFAVAIGFATIGFLCILNGLKNMATGTNKLQ